MRNRSVSMWTCHCCGLSSECARWLCSILATRRHKQSHPDIVLITTGGFNQAEEDLEHFNLATPQRQECFEHTLFQHVALATHRPCLSWHQVSIGSATVKTMHLCLLSWKTLDDWSCWTVPGKQRLGIKIGQQTIRQADYQGKIETISYNKTQQVW